MANTSWGRMQNKSIDKENRLRWFINYSELEFSGCWHKGRRWKGYNDEKLRRWMKYITSFNILAEDWWIWRNTRWIAIRQKETTKFVFCCTHKSVLEKWLAKHRRSSVSSYSLDNGYIIRTTQIIHYTKTVTNYQTSELPFWGERIKLNFEATKLAMLK